MVIKGYIIACDSDPKILKRRVVNAMTAGYQPRGHLVFGGGVWCQVMTWDGHVVKSPETATKEE